jgi:hypothetical protein
MVDVGDGSSRELDAVKLKEKKEGLAATVQSVILGLLSCCGGSTKKLSLPSLPCQFSILSTTPTLRFDVCFHDCWARMYRTISTASRKNAEATSHP